MNCALQLFSARGYDAVGVQEIVEAAGVTKPTLYHYFGSKEGLLEALLKAHFSRLTGQVEKAVEYNHDLTTTLTRVAGTFFAFARENPLFYRMQLALWFAPPASDSFKLVSKLDEELYQLIEELFQKAANDHGNMRGRHRAYAVTFLGMINNYIAISLNDYVVLDSTVLYQAVHQFMHGIFS